jgi:regulator of PEP synthase PpsR (kinase-PPPase family)
MGAYARLSAMSEEPQVPPKHAYTLHIISDATGTLARSVISAVLTQFPDLQAKQIYRRVHDPAEAAPRHHRHDHRGNHANALRLLGTRRKNMAYH